MLLALTDDLGHVLELRDDGTYPGRATQLRYDGTTYVTYGYSSDGLDLHNARDSDGNTLASYDYASSTGRLLTVRNEAGDPIVEFGYDGAGQATSLKEASGDIQVSYAAEESTAVRRNSNISAKSVTRKRRTGGGHSTTAGGATQVLEQIRKRLRCFENKATGIIDYYDRDLHGRVLRHRQFAPGVYECGYPSEPTATPMVDEFYAYEATATIAQFTTGDFVTLSLDKVTRYWRGSTLLHQEASFSDPGIFERFYDYDPAPKTGILDPSGYSCGAEATPQHSVLCRVVETGLTWDLWGNVIREQHATFFSYDARGRLVGRIGPMTLGGSVGEVVPREERSYWPDTDPLDRRGRLRTLTQFVAPGRGLTRTYDYTALGVHTVADSAGRTSLFVRDGRGRVTHASLPGYGQIELRYYDGQKPRLELLGRAAVSGEAVFARQTTYDLKGRPQAITSWAGDPEEPGSSAVPGWTETRQYDDAGNATNVALSDEAGLVRWVRARTFGADHELATEVHPEDPTRTATWAYALDGTLKAITDEEARTTEFVPDVMNRVAVIRRSATQGSGDVVRQNLAAYEYLPEVQAIRVVTDGAGRATRYRYDDFARVRSVANADTIKAGAVWYAHDARGNVTRKRHAGVTETYDYDGLDRLARRTATNAHDGEVIAYDYEYDSYPDGTPGAAGLLTRIVEAARTTTYRYDDAGRLRFEIVKEGAIVAELTTEYRYDADGLLNTLVYPTGLQVEYARDPATKAVTAVRNSVTGEPFASAVRHHPYGPLTSLTYGNGIALTQTFNRRYEPQTIAATSAAGPILDLTYVMSPAGDVSTLSDGQNVLAYGHDLVGRLASADLGAGATAPQPTRFLYVGDRIIGAQDPATGAMRYAYGYDDQSNLSAISRFGADGVTVETTLCLKHDALSRLVLVGLAAPATGGPDASACRSEAEVVEALARFEYDAHNRRVVRWSAETGERIRHVLRSDGGPLAELVAPTSNDGTWTPRREVVQVDAKPIAQVEHGAAGARVYSVHLDHIGLPRALANSAQDVVWRAAPDPYGGVAETLSADPISGQQVVTNQRLPGQYDERVLGSVGLQGPYYNWNRWYLPGLGRYLELDPIALRGGFNGIGWFAPDWYNYGGGNPLTNVDPLGLQAAQCLPGESTVVCCMKKFPGCPECCGATGPEPARPPLIPWPPPWWPWKDPQPPPDDCSPKKRRDCDGQYAADVAKCGTLPMPSRPPCYESAMTRKNLCEQGMPVPPLFTG